MNKFLATTLVLSISGSAALAAVGTSKTDTKNLKTKSELSRWSIGASSVVFQEPTKTKGTERLHGIGVEAQREISLGNGVYSNTVLGLDFFSNSNKENNVEADGSVERFENESNITIVTIGQTITGKVSTAIGDISVSALAGLSVLNFRGTGSNDFTDAVDSTNNESFSSESNGTGFGQVLGLSAALKLKNGIMPYVSYKASKINDFKVNFESKSNGVSSSDSTTFEGISAQSIAIGLGYRF